MLGNYDAYRQWDQSKRDEAVKDHLPLVYSLARRVMNVTGSRELEYGDLVNVGVLGLYAAWERFSPERGFSFGAYATHFVRGKMLDEVRKSSQLPKSVRQKHKQLRDAFDELSQQTLQTPTDEQLADYLGISLKEYYEWLNDVSWTSVWSIEELEAQGQFNEPDLDEELDPENHVDRQETTRLLAKALKKLTEKEQQVLYAYYQEELTMKEIGFVMDLSESQVSRIHSKAVLRLRGMLGRSKSDMAVN